MKRMACEMCGSTDLIKQDGVFVCESCGCKYSAEEAKKLLVEIEDVVDEHHDEDQHNANEKRLKKTKKFLSVLGILIIACVAAFFVITKVIIPNNNYNAAVALMEAGQYEEAIAAFEAVEGYKDSTIQIENCYIGKYGEEKWNLFKSIKVGDTYVLGAYEQDNNTSNGKEAIEWIVLDNNGRSLLLISRQALACKQYNTSNANVTWENCSLRKWLNGTFLNDAFSTEEQERILSTKISADKNPEYNTDPGNATTDKVFLLSITEAEKYFTTDSVKTCTPTKYVTSNKAYKNSDNENCWWWLRSPGDGQHSASFVRVTGMVYYRGYTVNYGYGCVRPAMWINIGD